jgi:outer membrane biosynthesis protein TonB
MSPRKPKPSSDTETEHRSDQRLSALAFDTYTAETAQALGDSWTVVHDQAPHPELSAYLEHTDGRRIGIRHLWRGLAVQTWALKVPPREFTNEADAESHELSVAHLTPGVRYNVAVCFTDVPPVEATVEQIRARLLPAFEGQRPVLRAFPKKRRTRGPVLTPDVPTKPEQQTQPAEEGTQPTEPANATAAKPKPKPTRRSAAKKPTPPAPAPASESTEPKKPASSSRTRRTPTTGAKSRRAVPTARRRSEAKAEQRAAKAQPGTNTDTN